MTSQASHEPFSQALDAGNLRRAGEWLVRSFASEVYGLCQAIVRDSATAEDLSQEVFAKAFAGLDNFRGDASARTWLLAIARNRCIDHLRAQKRWSQFDTDSDPEELADEPTLPQSLLSSRREIDKALQDLTEIERALIVLRFRNGLAYEELAQAFGLKSGTVRMRVSRALAKMRESLEAPRALLQKSMSSESIAQRMPGLASAPMPAATPKAPEAPRPRAPAGAPTRSGVTRSRRSAPPAPQAAIPVPAQSSKFGEMPSSQAPHPLRVFFADTSDSAPANLCGRLGKMASALPAPH